VNVRRAVGASIAVITIILTDVSPAGNPSLYVSPNFRIYPSATTQTEVFITVHPNEPATMFASANTIRFQPSFFISEGVYITTNAGSTWFGSDSCSGSPVTFHGGDPGIAIDKNGVFLLTRRGRAPLAGLYSHFSTNRGTSWSGQLTITTEELDRATVASDVHPASLFYGRTYAVWARLTQPYPVSFSRTDNGGTSWSPAAVVNSPLQRCAGGEVAVGSDGRVYICWAVVSNVSPFTEVFTGFARSSDGGATWSIQENAYPTTGIQGVIPEKQNIRVNGLPRIDIDRSGGPRHDWIYIATTEKNRSPAGTDPDIILHRSSNGGTTWSSGIRVNQDPLNNGKIQFFPAIHVDSLGAVNIIYYDDRTTSSDSAGVFLSRSTDGGDTWSDTRISDHHFKPVPIGGLGQGYQGDNIGLTSSLSALWPVWMDNSSGIYQIWTARVQLPPVSVTPHSAITPEEFDLQQNYPNPFNPRTRIEYHLKKAAHVRLVIYDLKGNSLATLVNARQHAGSYYVTLDEVVMTQASSGVYFYRLTVDQISLTRKMVLMK
jgi:hypothetical protein